MLQQAKRRLSAICNCCPEPFAATGVSRRQFLAGGTALAASAAVSGFAPQAFAQAKPHRIDVHHHIAPPSWLNAMDIIGRTNPPLAHWSVQKTLDDMDKGGVATSITSPTAPQVATLGVPVAIKLARESNEFAKRMESDHKGRFGTFAMLPMPHIDATLKEIEYAFDTLKVDGVGIMTNYGDKWLGYSYFDPVWAELNRRKATIYTHPGDANCCVNLVQGMPSSAIEWGTDTTRSIANLIFSGSSQKYPDINWIFSHGGGALTSFSERFLLQLPAGALPRQVHPRAGSGATRPLPLRHRASRELGRARRALQARAGVADRVRNRLPVPHRGRSHQGPDGLLQCGRPQEGRP